MTGTHRSSDDAEVKITKDGSGVVLNWKSLVAIIGAAVTVTAMYSDIKNESKQQHQEIVEVKAVVQQINRQVTAQGRVIDSISARVKLPVQDMAAYSP